MSSPTQAPYKELVIWQTGKDLALAMYQTTQEFPETERLFAQELRSVASQIPSVVAAGHDNRFEPGTFEAALHKVREQVVTLELLVELALDLGLIEDQAVELKEYLSNLGKLSFGMLKKIREKKKE